MAGGSGGGWHGGGSNWHGGGWHGGGYGYRGGWYGGWYGPGLGLYLGGPGYWGWGAWPYPYAASYPVYSGYAASYPVYSTADVGASGSYISAAPDPAANAANYWYYCTDPAGYFPYVQNCSRAWMQVVPQNLPGAPAAPAPQ